MAAQAKDEAEGENLVPRNYLVTQDQSDRLADLAHDETRRTRKRVTQAQLVREALDDLFAKRDKRAAA